MKNSVSGFWQRLNAQFPGSSRAMATAILWLQRATKTVLTILVTGTVLLLLVNAGDEDPDPGLRDYLSIDPPAVGVNGNAFFTFMGIDAPADTAPSEWGYLKMAQDRNKVRSGRLYEETQAAKAMEMWDQGLKHPDIRPIACQKKGDCLSFFKANRKTIETALRTNQLQLQRFRAAYDQPLFLEATYPDMRAAVGNYAGAYQLLEYARIGISINDGRVDVALDLLEQNTGLWRRVMSQSTSLIGRMVSTRFVQNNYLLLGEMLRTQSFNRKQYRQAQRILRPLPPTTWDWREVYRQEFVLVYHSFEEAIRRGRSLSFHEEARSTYVGPLISWFEYRLFREQQTKNHWFAQARQLDQASVLVGEALHQRLVSAYDSELPSWGVGIVRNPVGKQLTDAGEIRLASHLHYKARAYNVELWRRLVSQQLALKTRDVRPNAVARSLSKELSNPVTGELPKWEPARKTLVFTGFTVETDRIEGGKDLLMESIEIRI